jgi:hypothetical protein
MFHSVAAAAQVQRLFELSHHQLERAAHAVELDIGSTP